MKRVYTTPPRIEVISIKVERGFADSLGTSILDYNKTEADSLDD